MSHLLQIFSQSETEKITPESLTNLTFIDHHHQQQRLSHAICYYFFGQANFVGKEDITAGEYWSFNRFRQTIHHWYRRLTHF